MNNRRNFLKVFGIGAAISTPAIVETVSKLPTELYRKNHGGWLRLSDMEQCSISEVIDNVGLNGLQRLHKEYKDRERASIERALRRTQC